MMTASGELITQKTGAPSLGDLAHGLAQMPRFGGQTVIPWTVADHLVTCDRIAAGRALSYRLRLHLILHDAHEMATGDIPTPMKTPDMKTLQAELDGRIYARFDLPWRRAEDCIVIKDIDRESLLAEAAVVTPARTYRRIVEEAGREAETGLVSLVEDYLHEDRDPEEAFLEAIMPLFILARTNDYTRGGRYDR